MPCHNPAHGRLPNVTGLTWGIPVNISELYAHLSAHARTAKACSALQLYCDNSIGGPAYIKTLPPELILEIIDVLVKNEREVIYSEIEKLRRCFEDECGFHDHFNEGEFHAMCQEAFEVVTEETPDLLSCRRSSPELDSDSDDGDRPTKSELHCEIEEYLKHHHMDVCGCRIKPELVHEITKYLEDYVDEKCGDWGDNFEAKMVRFAKACSTRTSDIGKLLRNHYKLGVHIAKYTIPRPFRVLTNSKTPIAFLALPRDWLQTLSNVDASMASLPEEARKRFEEAMKALRLQPYVHPTLVQTSLCQRFPGWTSIALEAQELVRNETEDLTRSSWPKLMNLVRNENVNVLPCCDCEG
ncbi:hypothetical protein NA57DRAFT_78159 [Rhizodiscina lignyota]|uniref:Uncharacterized protein n=1 Tax=Rhizodiscina lignyota TaxID=1504668 RepID=A0A9P4IC48_9PEZI|nr:hypothetical protein NA57DRAFT_78159 [Rhizodiscina lignyota]